MLGPAHADGVRGPGRGDGVPVQSGVVAATGDGRDGGPDCGSGQRRTGHGDWVALREG